MKRFPTLITIVALIGAIAITLFLADTALINEEISPVQKELLQLRNEIERLRGIESEYAARRQALDQLATYLTKERNEAERLRQIALEAARRMESGDATVLTDAQVAKALTEPRTFVLPGENLMEFKGPQGIVSFQGDDVIMVPDEGRVLVGRSEEIAGGLVSASDEFSQEATLHFRNESEDSRLVFWINGEGRPKLGGSVQPGEAFSIQTSMGHKWVITDLEGVRIGDLEPIHAGQDEDIILK